MPFFKLLIKKSYVMLEINKQFFKNIILLLFLLNANIYLYNITNSDK